MTPLSVPELRVGMRVRDNEAHREWHRERVMAVVSIDSVENCAWLEDSARSTIIAIRRIHLDGKPRRTGWSVVG